MKAMPYVVVGGWALGLLGLALGQIAFGAAAWPVVMYACSAVIVGLFGGLVLFAVQTERVGVQRRQPRSAAAAVMLALATALVFSGFVYGWWLSLLGLYPLLVALWHVRGERMPREARPWPAARGTEPAGRPRAVYSGSSLASTTPIPAEHPAHAPPRTTSSSLWSRFVWAIGAGAVVELIRRWRK